MADPRDMHAHGFYDAEMRGVIRALIALSFPVLSEIRATATNVALDRQTRIQRIADIGCNADPGFLVDYAFWLPWDEIKPGMDPDEIEQYRSR